MNRITVLVAASTALLGAVGAGPAGAHPQLVAESKKQGLPAQNCQYCHVSKVPAKSTYKPDDLNDRGKWLVTEKDKQKAKDVKAEWLKDYPGGKEQK
jgi:hypothetical protein